MAPAPQTWILTGSPENFAVTSERGFLLVGTALLLDRLRAAAGVVA